MLVLFLFIENIIFFNIIQNLMHKDCQEWNNKLGLFRIDMVSQAHWDFPTLIYFKMDWNKIGNISFTFIKPKYIVLL